MKILITGAAGKVGRATRKELAAAGHRLRLADVASITDAEDESVTLDIADTEAVRRAMEGMEAVAHLAYGHIQWGNDPSAADVRASFDVNLKGTFNLLLAAKQVGVKRFVYTTTLSVFGDFLNTTNEEITEQTPVCPDEIYGLTKYLGEEVCRYFARAHGVSAVCLRLCHVCDDADWARAASERNPRRVRWRGMATHVSDVARAIHRALTVPDLKFEILNIAANNPGRLSNIQRAAQVLGFTPQWRLKE